MHVDDTLAVEIAVRILVRSDCTRASFDNWPGLQERTCTCSCSQTSDSESA